MRLYSLSIFICMLLLIISCTADTGEEKDSIVITEARVREVPGGSDITAGYMKIENKTPFDDKLLNVKCGLSQNVQIHETYIDEKDIAGMRMIKSIDIASGEIFELKPSGYHLMIMGVEKGFNEKEKIMCELDFSKYGRVMVEAEITGF